LPLAGGRAKDWPPPSSAGACRLRLPLVALLLAAAVPAAAQDVNDVLQPGDAIDFAADALSYDNKAEIVTATGNVVIVREGYRLTAREVVYNRTTGLVEARGDVVVIDPGGNQAFGDRVEVSDSLRDAAIENILVVLEDGGRLAARSGKRVNGRSVLNRAVYSPCDIGRDADCPRAPIWQIKAVRVIHDPAKNRLTYKDAYLELFGVPLVYLPSLSHPDGRSGNASGLLVPDIAIDRQLGLELEFPYYWTWGGNKDLTVTPTVYTNVNPALGLEYRQMTDQGPLRFGAFGTESRRIDNAGVPRSGPRVYAFANGRLQHAPNLRSTFGVRYSSDDTLLRRYDISRDVTLRNFYQLERFTGDSYLNVSGWAFQGLRVNDRQGQSPIALPLIDFQYRPDFSALGGRLDLRVNTLAVTRTAGEDVRRALGSVRFDLARITPMGQRVTLSALARGDVYNVSDAALSVTPIYAASNGWHSRGLAAAAVDLEWPFAGPALGGVQTLTPRIQLVASSDGNNGRIPNEDSRAVEFEDTGLFEINRFPGFDRWESGARLTYGGRWTLERPRWSVMAEGGQSYRLSHTPSFYPDGSGADGKFSDYVARWSARYARLVDITQRVRLDKTSFAVRRNEIDLTLGGRRTFATLGYVRLNRDISIEDLPDREEARVGGRVQLARFWSVFGSAIVDLTGQQEDPTSDADGYEPVRHRIGFAYEDECFEFSLTWRRDYTEDRDFRRGNTFLLRLALKNLGR
jgi:LPS-assembly protein